MFHLSFVWTNLWTNSWFTEDLRRLNSHVMSLYMMTSSNGNTFRRYWPFVRGIHRSPVNSPHKGQWRGAFMFSLICACINDWVNNLKAGDLRRHRAHYDVTVMISWPSEAIWRQSSAWTLAQVMVCRHQAITWTNVGLSLLCRDIHLRPLSWEDLNFGIIIPPISPGDQLFSSLCVSNVI